MIQTFGVWCTSASRLNARPGDRKAVALLVKAFRQCNVLRIAVVLIAGDVSCRVSLYFTGGMAKAIPYGLAFAILIPCSLYLVGGRRRSPKKALRKAFLLDL